MKISSRQQRSVLSTYYFGNLSGLVKSGWGNKVGGCSTARAPHYLNFRPFWARASRATRQWVSPAAAAVVGDLLNLNLHLLPIQRQETLPEIERKGFCFKRWKWCSILAKQFVMECRGEGAAMSAIVFSKFRDASLASDQPMSQSVGESVYYK